MQSFHLLCSMTSILILGAGRSSSVLIQYALINASSLDWSVTVGDVSLEVAREKVGNNLRGKAIEFDINNAEKSDNAIQKADIVISILPAHLHLLVAKKCLHWKKHLLNASYVSDEMRVLDADAKKSHVLFLNECGLDPGIDHMSAMQVIDRIHSSGGKVISFESFTGGLIAPETDPKNPWRYKFTWNPRNVVMAGQSTAKYLEGGKFKYIPYHQLFLRTTPVTVPALGDYEGYANRDSLKYIDTYNLSDIQTMLRGTLRNKGYCAAWNILVQLGCCDDGYLMENVESMTHGSFVNSFLPKHNNMSVKDAVAKRFGLLSASPELEKLEWSGFFNDDPIGLKQGTPAQITEHILNKQWALRPEDKDQIVMWHRFIFEVDGQKKEIQSSLVATGNDSVNTAMAKTVGLPLGIVAKLLTQRKISARGVAIPTTREFYEPVLKELQTLGVVFNEI
jgi:saccharopine dehydrogenase (NADP+, L-glutamate forming)